MKLSAEFEITKIEGNRVQTEWDPVAVEYELALYVNGRHLSDLSCTPQNLEALVYGHLFTQGIIDKKEDLKTLVFDEDKAEAVLEREPGDGKLRAGATRPEIFITIEDLFTALEVYREKSPLFTATGGVHSCLLGWKLGESIIMEDVGRHNAIDKVLGQALLDNRDVSDAFVIIGGRVNASMVRKVIRAGLSILISRSAPSDQAVQLAQEAQVTLGGFARGKRLNIYSSPQRILVG